MTFFVRRLSILRNMLLNFVDNFPRCLLGSPGKISYKVDSSKNSQSRELYQDSVKVEVR